MNPTEHIAQDGFLIQSCCGCHLRHIWHFHIVRGETPDDDYIIVSITDDEQGTKLRKFYERENKLGKV